MRNEREYKRLRPTRSSREEIRAAIKKAASIMRGTTNVSAHRIAIRAKIYLLGISVDTIDDEIDFLGKVVRESWGIPERSTLKKPTEKKEGAQSAPKLGSDR